MITFLTGGTGSGKTLRAIWQGLRYVKEGRDVYILGSREPSMDGAVDDCVDGWYSGIRGLDFGRTGFKAFNADLSEWRQLPKRAVLIVDEAQRWLHRDRLPLQVPEWLEALTRNRHYGIDFIFITQDPRFLHTMARRLCNYHEHVRRWWGLNIAIILRWEALCEDVSRSTWKKKAEVSFWRYPRDVFDMYISAEAHTVKCRIPARVVFTVLSLLASVYGAYWVWGFLTARKSKSADVPHEVKSVSSPSPLKRLVSRGDSSDSAKAPLTVEEYVAAQVPRVAGQPWSASQFDDRKPRAEPEIYCVISDAKGCGCYTEQITRLRVPLLECYEIARHGAYNPYRAPAAVRTELSARQPGGISDVGGSSVETLPAPVFESLPVPAVVPEVLARRPLNVGSAWPQRP